MGQAKGWISPAEYEAMRAGYVAAGRSPVTTKPLADEPQEVVTECVCGQLPALDVARLRTYRAHAARDIASAAGEYRAHLEAELAKLDRWLEPARREVDALTLAACSDPFCAACLAQIAANEAAR